MEFREFYQSFINWILFKLINDIFNYKIIYGNYIILSILPYSLIFILELNLFFYLMLN